ncbi:FAD/NAD(P)-binding protein [Natrarchaeobius chitinivorans]|uniref:Pyridine nucleotide-disulfide oxidoreductase n=1 Tax=Natrarchaeobius chitinivorans TaxID=1679083 RepID=A0A3N6NB13_NATCH|nr:FAD/NAD(P)-binding protein [Natrarchaeobius chitinivorans]RQG95792.1 pyridine nucleotide-disulfide oxidoreductase [Natrarchaeobius chitinivorans]
MGRRTGTGETATDALVTIVGGGVHGVHLAVRLLKRGLVDRSELRIVDPPGLLESFRRKCRQCGMVEFRSPFVHHVGTDPFSLRNFARTHGREDELRSTTVGAERPTASLFFDHAGRLCDRYDLESIRLDARVTDLVDRHNCVEIETTDGPVSSRWCLLAVGYGRSVAYPEWATELVSTDSVSHVWEGFDPDAVDETASVGIVGGGITAAQLATTLAQPGRDVVLFARSPFRVETLEASTDWMHFSGVTERLHAHPPASRARAELVAEARYDGTIPPYAFRRLKRALERERVELERSEIAVATEAGGTVVVTCRDGSAFCLDELICATGFGSPYDGALFRQLRRKSTLQAGYRGAPSLDDDTLRWVRDDGTPSRIAVSGVAAQQVLGPFARNVIGARRAGELIVGFLESELDGEKRRVDRYTRT